MRSGQKQVRGRLDHRPTLEPPRDSVQPFHLLHCRDRQQQPAEDEHHQQPETPCPRRHPLRAGPVATLPPGAVEQVGEHADDDRRPCRGDHPPCRLRARSRGRVRHHDQVQRVEQGEHCDAEDHAIQGQSEQDAIGGLRFPGEPGVEERAHRERAHRIEQRLDDRGRADVGVGVSGRSRALIVGFGTLPFEVEHQGRERESGQEGRERSVHLRWRSQVDDLCHRRVVCVVHAGVGLSAQGAGVCCPDPKVVSPWGAATAEYQQSGGCRHRMVITEDPGVVPNRTSPAAQVSDARKRSFTEADR
jgi:hypothetical protein